MSRVQILLHEIESLAHAERVRRMVLLGRRISEPEVAAMLAELEQGGFFERLLAIHSCYGSRNAAHILRALADPSRTIRSLAVGLVASICDDETALAALGKLSLALQQDLLRRLWHRRRHLPIDSFLETLAAQRDTRLVRLLPFSSPEVVERFIDQMSTSAAADDWRRLARLHPTIAAKTLLRQAEALDRSDARLRWQANAALPILADSQPDLAVALVQALLRHEPPAALVLQPLVRRRPHDIAALVIAAEEQVVLSFEAQIGQLDPSQIAALVERGTLSEPEAWFDQLKPPVRALTYQTTGLSWRDNEGCLTPTLVMLLPGPLREAEARRHLQHPALAARPEKRLPFAAFLPWDEAIELLNPFVQNPDPELRSAGLRALIEAVRFQPERLSELLLLLRKRQHEQDPIRQVMLVGLATLPPSRFRAEHLEDVGQIVRAALDAADLSYGTAAATERLTIGLLPFHPDWGAQWLATLVKERGQMSLYYLAHRLSDDDVRRIAPALLPVLRSWETRERVRYILAAAQIIGRRLRVFDGLVAMLERTLRATWSPADSARALMILAEHRRDRIPELVPTLLREDQSWVTQPAVYLYVHRYRQDLLTPFLGQTSYRGRFNTGRTRFVLPLFSGFHRWTAQQQAIFAQTLERVTHDNQRDTPSLRLVIMQLAALQAVEPQRLIELAQVENRQPVVRELALRALGQLDGEEGVQPLLDALTDERARVAIYALRRILLQLPPERALAILRNTPLERVTVAKEVIRLIGELPGEEAYAELLTLESRELHRDVRVALLRAFWNHLERNESWQALEKAALASDLVEAASVVRVPADRLSPNAQQRLARLLASLLRHPDPKVRLDTLLRCVALPIADTEQVLLQPLLTLLGSQLTDERAAAAGAIFATYTGNEAVLIGQAVSGFLAHRRVLITAVEQLRRALPDRRTLLLPTIQATLAALQTDPLTVTLQAELAVEGLPWDNVAALFEELVQRNELHAEALMTAVRALQRTGMRPDLAGLVLLEERLAPHPDERLRRLGLAALVGIALRRGWDESRIAQLEIYRRDPSPLVAAAAAMTLPPEH